MIYYVNAKAKKNGNRQHGSADEDLQDVKL